MPIEVQWRILDNTHGVQKICADFGSDRVIEAEIVHEGRILDLVAAEHATEPGLELLRINCGDLIVAAKRTLADTFDFHCNQETFDMTLSQTTRAGEVALGEDVLLFRPDPVAGYWVTLPNGRRLVRQAYPWRDRDRAVKAKWVSHIEAEQFPWPLTGIALALLALVSRYDDSRLH